VLDMPVTLSTIVVALALAAASCMGSSPGRGGATPAFEPLPAPTPASALEPVIDHPPDAGYSEDGPYAPFFGRVRTQLLEYWRPKSLYDSPDHGASVYGSRNRYTEVRLKLAPDGRLESVTIVRPSGLELLDDEAIAAVENAQRFPPPPPQLIDADGLVTFRFGFFYDVGSGAGPDAGANEAGAAATQFLQ
jgi:TonB family protein